MAGGAGAGWLVEVLEPLAPRCGIKSLVLLACTHRQFNQILREDCGMWQASVRAAVDIPFDLVFDEGVTWRYLAMQVLDGLSRLGCSGAEVRPRTVPLACNALCVRSTTAGRRAGCERALCLAWTAVSGMVRDLLLTTGIHGCPHT
jgi:hypothetical protein